MHVQAVGYSLIGVKWAYFRVFLLQRSLATDLQSLSMELRKKQSTYLKRLRQQKEVWKGFSFSYPAIY